MGKLKKEEYEFLKSLEPRFQTLMNDQYMRGMSSSEIERVRDIYVRVAGLQEYRMNMRCSSCVAKLMENVYPFYDEYRNGHTKRSNSSQKSDNIEGTGCGENN